MRPPHAAAIDRLKAENAQMREALEAHALWADAEDQGLGTFQDRMELCHYAEWLTDKALGRPHDEVYAGVPQLIIRIAGGDS